MEKSPSFVNFHIKVSSLLPHSWNGITLILSLIQEGKSKESLSHFHSGLPRKSAMVSYTSSLVSGPSINSLNACPRIHLSIQTFFLELFLTLHQIPLEKAGKPALIAFQLGEEGRSSGLLEIILAFEQYFFMIRAIFFSFSI